jgi:hypothetical protein
LSELSSATIGILTLAGMDGGNGGWAILYDANPVSGSSVSIAIDEDVAGDTERSHITEQVAYVVFGSEIQPDEEAPEPNLMTWAIEPYATGTTSIAMVATTATDPSGVEYYFDETSENPGGTNSDWQESSSYENMGLSAGTTYIYTVKARDKSSNHNETAVSDHAPATTEAEDTTPPNPDPMTWATEPYATGTTSIAMIATTTTDPGGVEYYFDETSGNPGGTDSGWQGSSSYENMGLSAGTTYIYTVKARDKSPNYNETEVSEHASATTEAEDTTPPNPDPMTWATEPYAIGTTSIAMVATTVSDPSGVEYYFDELSGTSGGSDSGWQDTASFTDTGLNADTTFTYRVRARDKSANQNQTAWSSELFATTDAEAAKSGCGNAPMYRDSGRTNLSASNSVGNAFLPLLPSMMALGLWRIKRAGRSRKKR